MTIAICFDDLWDYKEEELNKVYCCTKEIKFKTGYCSVCWKPNPEAIERDRRYQKTKFERLKGEAKVLAQQEFNQNMCETIFDKLPSLNKISIKDLVKIMWESGMLKVPDDEASKTYIAKCGGVIAWAKRRAIGLAKWWGKNRVAFVGTLHTQGHGYCIYMPDSKEAKEAGFTSKAEWSVQNLRKYSENVDSSDIEDILKP